MGYFYSDEESEELAHHGILGQKWGVRRYQNYDGSLTRAGMKRYNESKEAFNKADQRLKDTQEAFKQNKASKADLDNAKLAKTKAEKQMNKDYKHLKKDKMADQGKSLYASGKTITGNNQVTNILNTIGSVGLSAALINARTGGSITWLLRQHAGMKIDDKDFLKVAGGIGAAALGASAIKKGVNEYQNKRLRAYYSHTSSY